MLPWLGARVHAAPFGARVAAYTALSIAHWFAVQALVSLLVLLYIRLGWTKKNTRAPALPLWRMLLEQVAGYASWTIGVGLVQAWYNPTPSDWSMELSWMKMLWYQFPMMLLYDTWFYFSHRYCHVNKWLFRHVHGKHHRSEAYLDITSSSFEHPVDGIFAVGIPTGLMMLWGLHTRQFWPAVVMIHTTACVIAFGHTGYEFMLDEMRDAALLSINPFLLMQVVAANRAQPMEHEQHHTNPRSNFGLFFTFWDDLLGTANVKRRPHPWQLWAPHLIFYVCLTYYYQWVLYDAPRLFLTLLALHALGPLSRLTYALLGGAVSDAVSRLPVWDALRRLHMITYAPPGSPGAFEADPARRYIFCYQPMGVHARGAWHTFAGKGRGSPVARLRSVKLAVGRVLWALPVAQPVFALYDCCDSSYRTLRALLSERAPKSVCITVGGWREAKYLGSYAVVANRRRGFVRLALETGAALVPVIGVGEPYLAGRPCWGARVSKALLPYRPHPLKVVFGAPLAPRDGETVEQLHARYCAALLALGKQHNVPLRIVE